MVKESPHSPRAAELALAVSYAPAEARPGIAAMFALDERLRGVVQRVRDPMIGTMRLVWWRDALARLDAAPAPAEPLLRMLAAEVLPHGVTGADMAPLAAAWGRALEEEPDWALLAGERGRRLFGLAARILGVEDGRVADVGEAWAAVDAARDWPAATVATGALAEAYASAWPRALRPLGALGLLARFDAGGATEPGDVRRVARLLAHRLTGR